MFGLPTDTIRKEYKTKVRWQDISSSVFTSHFIELSIGLGLERRITLCQIINLRAFHTVCSLGYGETFSELMSN